MLFNLSSHLPSFQHKRQLNAQKNQKPSQTTLRLLDLLRYTAIVFKLCNISKDTDLELTARLGPIAKRVIEDDILLCN